jgi:hypothetical protein
MSKAHYSPPHELSSLRTYSHLNPWCAKVVRSTPTRDQQVVLTVTGRKQWFCAQALGDVHPLPSRSTHVKFYNYTTDTCWGGPYLRQFRPCSWRSWGLFFPPSSFLASRDRGIQYYYKTGGPPGRARNKEPQNHHCVRGRGSPKLLRPERRKNRRDSCARLCPPSAKTVTVRCGAVRVR